MEDVLSDIRDILVKFDYPGVNDIIADEEFIEIMKASNRKDLLSWFLKTLDDCYMDLLEDSNETFLVDHMHELGFCCQRESQKFVRGNLDPLREMEIIYSMLKYLRKIKMANSLSHSIAISMNSVEILDKKVINLFPMFGDIKQSISDEKCTEDTNESTILTQLSPEKHPGDIAYNLEKISISLPKLERVSKSMNVTDRQPLKLFHLDNEILYKCNENIKVIEQYTEDVAIVIEFLNCEHTSIDAKDNINETKTLFDTLLSLMSDFVSEN